MVRSMFFYFCQHFILCVWLQLLLFLQFFYKIILQHNNFFFFLIYYRTITCEYSLLFSDLQLLHISCWYLTEILVSYEVFCFTLMPCFDLFTPYITFFFISITPYSTIAQEAKQMKDFFCFTAKVTMVKLIHTGMHFNMVNDSSDCQKCGILLCEKLFHLATYLF